MTIDVVKEEQLCSLGDEANRPKRIIFCGCQKGEWRAREEVRCLSVAPIRD
jgi:hypothetical protein